MSEKENGQKMIKVQDLSDKGAVSYKEIEMSLY